MQRALKEKNLLGKILLNFNNIDGEFMKKITDLARDLLFRGFYLISCVYLPCQYYISYKFGELSYLTKSDYKIWMNSMKKMLKEYCWCGYNFRVNETIYAFSRVKIEVVKRTDVKEVKKDTPIVVLCVKNDLKRLQMLVEHYRMLGVHRFAFLDNNSTDGTYEWMLNQVDIDVYRTTEPYRTAIKEGWINRIVSYYGFNRWYILTDSDELLVYEGMEEKGLSDVIKYAEKNNLERFLGLTLDVYTIDGVFKKSDNIKEDYKWIDSDSYYKKDFLAGKEKIDRYVGGPRYRLMGSTITLSKYPLIFFSEGTISCSAHFQYPFEKARDVECNMGILHYKFIEGDLEEYKRRMQMTSGFSNNGYNYKQYVEAIEKDEIISFMYEGSVEFSSSEVLKNITDIKPLAL